MDSLRRIIDVSAQAGERDVPVGTLVFASLRGRTSCSFAYAGEWLAMPGAFAIDPALPLASGFRHALPEQETFGCFADVCPGRWGRKLLRGRRLKAGLPAPEPADFLLAADGEACMGAMRFRLRQEGEDCILPADCPTGTPAGIARLAALAEARERSGFEAGAGELAAASACLGGSRPKVSAAAPDGSLWIAKFPSLRDEEDACLLEKLNFDAAEACGMAAPETKLLRLKSGRHVLLSRRFDRRRTPDGAVRRIPYASAMTLLGACDGEADHSYVELAMLMQEQGGARAAAFCRELWRRELFNVLAGNRDDHLRNHAFLRQAGAWAPSPVFDLECAKGKRVHALALDAGGSRKPDMEAAFDAAEWFGLAPKEALEDARRFARTVEAFSDRKFCAARGLSAVDRAVLAESRSGVRWPEFFAGERLRRTQERPAEPDSPDSGCSPAL